MSEDYFDQSTGDEFEEFDEEMEERAEEMSASMKINNSVVDAPIGTNLLSFCKEQAYQAGFGKFRVYLNGSEIKPSTEGIRDRAVMEGDRLEVRPFDEAG